MYKIIYMFEVSEHRGDPFAEKRYTYVLKNMANDFIGLLSDVRQLNVETLTDDMLDPLV